MRRMNNTKICPVLSAKLQTQSNEELPVIVRVRENDTDKLNSLAHSMEGKVKRSLPLVDAIALNMNMGEIDKLSRDPNVEYISYDSKVFALLDIANASIGGSFPRGIGLTGEGVTVAVIDTGVSPHNDLTRPKNRIIGFKDFVGDKANPYDDNGHGTHVAGIIASNGYSSNRKYMGVAPNANILAVKALDDAGSGNTSDIVSAIDWVVKTREQYKTKIINLSLGSPANNSINSDPLVRAVEAATKAGLTVIVAAGNSGPSTKTILSPGNSPNVITVGAVDDKRTPDTSDDIIANFSSRGPTKEGLRKPDVVAPGVSIMSLSNKSSDGYVTSSGTSMATPLVSGSAALICSKYGNLSPSQIKAMFVSSCTDLKDKQENQGAGIIDLRKLFKSSDNESPKTTPPSRPPRFPISPLPPKEEKRVASSDSFNEFIIVLVLVLLILAINTNK
ncbi:S8 family peptidase [Proteiniborus sp. MB09-C3]|uniref:S8 family peptidase n=1 Tax=Proteiniborus sp. MB09-C3 TaxID=3050072 RepID=UPI0025547173|nr:S8 family peptidase [Proteiniborus sp. MB09-C3]WIV12512.1 S8 family peptidase [Proteiniborus sp. MB09-C3]